jgi:hypothetical protein
MADEATARRKYAPAKQPDRLNPEFTDRVPKVSEKRRLLWDALHEFCREQGAWVTSIPHTKELRVECRKDSSLPAKLVELGYDPHHCETRTRIESGKFMSVDVISILLPGKNYKQ